MTGAKRQRSDGGAQHGGAADVGCGEQQEEEEDPQRSERRML